MPDRSRQKERKRLKRKRKQESLRKIASISPFKAISRMPAEVQCWMNLNWKITRQANIVVLRQTRSGRCAMASFLVDFGMAGLKDAWGRIDVTAAEVHKQVLEPMRQHFAVGSIDVSEAARFIAGGLRFAHDNGFRLPHRYERWLSILGDIGDWHQADTSDFEMEFAGSYDDLRRRLVGQSVEEFLQRKDVRFVLSDDAPSLLSDDVLDFEEADDEFRHEALEAVSQWLSAQQETPSPLLEDAWEIYVETFGETADLVQQAQDDRSKEKDTAIAIMKMMSHLIQLHPPEDHAELKLGIEQIVRFSTENRETMDELLTLPDDQ